MDAGPAVQPPARWVPERSRGSRTWQLPRGWLLTLPLAWSLLGRQGTSWWSHLLAYGACSPKSLKKSTPGGLLQVSSLTSLFKYLMLGSW